MAEDIKQQMQKNFISYASYVILDRAIPSIVDGLKPVQRRILHALYRMQDGKMHKVANAAGQAMAFHPHGDAPIVDALVNMANKGYLLDRQGNFGNIYTGDPAAAARYIESRLSSLALETMFNPDLTEMVPSYDGRAMEPVELPAKIPLVLMQGAEGIAVGMSTKILPHNFTEVLEAEIAILEGNPFELIPDFPTGGFIDASEYHRGMGKVKVRCKIDSTDPKTLVIRDICYGTTTESLIRSIDEAAKKGKIKIDSISDFTAEKVEIEIKLPRGHYAQDLEEALYAYTECEVALHSQIVVIKENMPWEGDVHEILRMHTEQLKGYLRRELEIKQERILQKIFEKTLEQIFIENKLYKELEEVKAADKLIETVETSLIPFHRQLFRKPDKGDVEKLLQIPIRRISRFDLDKNQEEIASLQKELEETEKSLKNIKRYTINYLKDLIKKYGKEFPRRTQITSIEEVDKRSMEVKQLLVGFDFKTGFLGVKVKGEKAIACTNFDKLIVFYQDGVFKVMNVPEKQYLNEGGKKALFVQVADKKGIVNIVYKDPKTHYAFAKRFVVKQFILEKEYRFMEEGMELLHYSFDSEQKLEIQFIPTLKQKQSKVLFSFAQALVKGVSAKGIRVANKAVKKIRVM